eukprot:4840275-Pleurochrysis_carterae.AAC.3
MGGFLDAAADALRGGREFAHSCDVASSSPMAVGRSFCSLSRRRSTNCWQRKARPVMGTDGSSLSNEPLRALRPGRPCESGWWKPASLRSRMSRTASCTCEMPRQMNCALPWRTTTRRHWHTHITS